MSNEEYLEVSATINAPLDQVWDKWTQAEADFRDSGFSKYRMEAKDGSSGFDLKATFMEIEPSTFIATELEDGRKVEVKFIIGENFVLLQQRFQPENQNSLELQQQGWQAILHQFKSYCEQ